MVSHHIASHRIVSYEYMTLAPRQSAVIGYTPRHNGLVLFRAQPSYCTYACSRCRVCDASTWHVCCVCCPRASCTASVNLGVQKQTSCASGLRRTSMLSLEHEFYKKLDLASLQISFTAELYCAALHQHLVAGRYIRRGRMITDH